MDNQRFDRLTRAMAAGASRRRVLAGLTGLALGALGRRAGAQSEESDLVAGRRRCGGIAGIPCPDGYICVDDPSDECDPRRGGADCGGVCRRLDASQCATILCMANTQCCPTCDGIGTCVPIGQACPRLFCGEPCGNVFCGADEFCCNASCSVCAPFGGACTDEFCGESCGTVVCAPGEVCCNESCSICTPPGGACPEMWCGEPCGPGVVCEIDESCCPDCDGGGTCRSQDSPCPRPACPPPGGEPCGGIVCDAGEYCCNPSCSICAPIGASCTQQFCGDPCGDRQCGPNDSCCPDCRGGRYCARPGDPCPACPDPGGEVCGPTVCQPGEVCCNESCGICTPPDGVCIMIACV